METTANRIKQVMREQGLRQADVLRLCKPICDRYYVKLGSSDLSQFINGKVSPGRSKLAVLGMALGVSETWLLGYDVPKEREDGFISTDAPLLTEDEQKLLDGYRELSEQGKEYILQTLEMARLVYIKNHAVSNVEKNA